MTALAAAAARRSSPSVWPASATPAPTPSPPTATASGCCWVRARAHRQGAVEAHARGPRREHDHRVPRHLENERGNSVRTRNARLTAIHSFFHYAALKAPERAELIARVLAIPEKRFDTTRDQLPHRARDRRATRRAGPLHLDRAARPRAAAAGGTDRAASLRARKPALPRRPARTGALGQMRGQRPKGRCTPLTRQTRDVLRVWLRERDGTRPARCFPAAAAGA